MKTLIVEYLRLKAAEIGGVDEHLGLTEKREGGDVIAPYIYVGGGDIRPVNIDSGSLGWFRTYQKEEFVTVDGMRAARDIQGTLYIRYAAILHRDTRNHNEYAEDIANAFTGISADLKQILKARKVDISRSSIETDITRAWREEFTTPVTDLNYRLGMVLVDVTVNVTGSRDCWQGCSELADILQGFDWCNPATFQRLTEAQQECVSDQICPIPEPCEDGTVNITDSASNPIASVQVASGGVEPFPLPDTPVQAVDSAATVGASGTVLSVTGGDVAIPDKDYTDSDGVVKSVAAFAPIVCTPQAPAAYPTTAIPIKSGQTISYTSGDDGDLQLGRQSDFFTLAENNHFGNTDRFTDALGGQVYADGIVLDHSTFEKSTGRLLGWNRNVVNAGTTWQLAFDNRPASVGAFAGGWEVPSMVFLNYTFYIPVVGRNYAPFNMPNVFNLWSSNTFPNNTANAYLAIHNATIPWRADPKTSSYRVMYVRIFNISEL